MPKRGLIRNIAKSVLKNQYVCKIIGALCTTVLENQKF